jgi:hypothetical protein
MDKFYQREPLPFSNANLTGEAHKIVRHPIPKQAIFTAHFDEAGWIAHQEEVRQKRWENYNNTDFQTRPEIYKNYPLMRSKQSFMEYDAAKGKWLCEWEENVFYAEDAAQITKMCGVSLNKDRFEQIAGKYNANDPDYIEQLAAFDSKYQLRYTEPYVYDQDATTIELYNERMQLLCICISAGQAEKEVGISRFTLLSAANNRSFCQGYYCRWFYDNDYKHKTQYKFEQLLDGQVVNRFISVKDAGKRLNISRDSLYRLLKYDNYTDQYGCTWRKQE